MRPARARPVPFWRQGFLLLCLTSPRVLVQAVPARRLARMLGLDLEEASPQDWQQLARYFSEQQLQTLMAAVDHVLSRARLDADAPLVGAGVGRFLVKHLADRAGRSYVDLLSLFRSTRLAAGDPADCAPAVAVAWLARYA